MASLPEGAQALFLTGASQEIYGVRADVDVTPDNPAKLVATAILLNDMKMRAAVSGLAGRLAGSL